MVNCSSAAARNRSFPFLAASLCPRQHDAETRFADDAADDRLVVKSQTTETHIDAAILQRRELFQCSHLQKIYFCARCDDAKSADQLRQRVVCVSSRMVSLR